MSDSPALASAVDRFAALDALPRIHALMTTRQLTPGEKARHSERTDLLKQLLPCASHFQRCVQTHGRNTAFICAPSEPLADCDALCTDVPGLALLISAADCCPVFLADPVRCAIGIAHSGRKGSELGIAASLVGMMVSKFDCIPKNMVAQLGPCARPPQYQVDFASWIKRSLLDAGLLAENIHDCGVNTIVRVDRYFSHRAEKGDTGRMAAVIVIN